MDGQACECRREDEHMPDMRKPYKYKDWRVTRGPGIIEGMGMGGEREMRASHSWLRPEKHCCGFPTLLITQLQHQMPIFLYTQRGSPERHSELTV